MVKLLDRDRTAQGKSPSKRIFDRFFRQGVLVASRGLPYERCARLFSLQKGSVGVLKGRVLDLCAMKKYVRRVVSATPQLQHNSLAEELLEVYLA